MYSTFFGECSSLKKRLYLRQWGFKLEDYLKLTKKINNRQLLAKFRTSDHPLEIELRRYKKNPRHQRLCKSCKVLDDEIHFFLQCQINNNLRNVLINNIEKYHANFDQLDSFSQVRIILIPNQEFLSSVVDCIKQSLELRK